MIQSHAHKRTFLCAKSGVGGAGGDQGNPDLRNWALGGLVGHQDIELLFFATIYFLDFSHTHRFLSFS